MLDNNVCYDAAFERAKLFASGFCTKMDGSIANGRRIIKVLLWIEPEACKLCHVPEELL